MYREYLTRNTRTKVRNTVYEVDESLREEGYRIVVSADGRAEIFYRGERGKLYAERTLKSLTDRNGTLVAEVEDYPSFPLRGIIEGFYGTPYSWEKRADVIDFAAEHRMNAYFYAPKDDMYHRDLWREPYPAETLRKIGELKKRADEKLVDFYFCLSPGKDFRYDADEDYGLLMKKYAQVAEVGVKDFAVLFDDIAPKLSEHDAEKFSSVADAHCYLANFLRLALSRKHRLVFCPTDYSQNTDTEYRKTVRKHLEKDIQVIWTGYNTVAEAIPERDCIAVKESFGHDMVLWDNYPVNDFEPKRRIYLGAVCNRTRKIADYHVGVIANPSELWESSKFALCTMSEWMWNAENYDDGKAYRRAVKELLDASKESLFFVGLNRSSVMRVYPTLKERFEADDRVYLDAYYQKAERSVVYVRSICGDALREEWADLFEYVLSECDLYRALRSGKDVSALLARMKKLRYRTADQSILHEIARRGLGEDTAEAERRVYWNTEQS